MDGFSMVWTKSGALRTTRSSIDRPKRYRRAARALWKKTGREIHRKETDGVEKAVGIVKPSPCGCGQKHRRAVRNLYGEGAVGRASSSSISVRLNSLSVMNLFHLRMKS